MTEEIKFSPREALLIKNCLEAYEIDKKFIPDKTNLIALKEAVEYGHDKKQIVSGVDGHADMKSIFAKFDKLAIKQGLISEGEHLLTTQEALRLEQQKARIEASKQQLELQKRNEELKRQQEKERSDLAQKQIEERRQAILSEANANKTAQVETIPFDEVIKEPPVHVQKVAQKVEAEVKETDEELDKIKKEKEEQAKKIAELEAKIKEKETKKTIKAEELPVAPEVELPAEEKENTEEKKEALDLNDLLKQLD